MSTAIAEQLLQQLQKMVPMGTQPLSEGSAQQWQAATDVLRKLKLELVQFHSSPPYSPEEILQVKKVLQLQRSTLELAAFLALYSRDVPAFQRCIAQLKTLYNDMRALMPPSPNQAPLLGAFLLSLLSQNQIADFHTEYELLAHAATSAPPGSSAAASSQNLPPASPTSSRSVSSSALLSSSFIAFPVSLEQQLMEGSYSKILAARAKGDQGGLPLPVYALFLDTLAETVRGKIADCSEQAYSSLSLADLQQLLRLRSAAEASKFASARPGWTVQGHQVVFPNKSAAGNTEIQAMKTIQQTLAYATELERIV